VEVEVEVEVGKVAAVGWQANWTEWMQNQSLSFSH